MPLETTSTPIAGLLLVRPRRFADARGHFEETWNADDFDQTVGRPVTFVQDNASVSAAGVLRGLHFQRPPMAQAKLVRCTHGAIFDVAVDLRPDSPTRGQHFAVELTADSGWQLFIPEGFAHGFLALTDGAHVHYKCTAPYSPAHEGSLRWDDPHLAIPWPLTTAPLLSPKDAAAEGWG
jgi:dTDP-4-dehydrorhamnose 3,5-epimerase